MLQGWERATHTVIKEDRRPTIPTLKKRETENSTVLQVKKGVSTLRQ